MKKKENTGLCEICQYRAACIWTGDMKQPRVYCEEFRPDMSAAGIPFPGNAAVSAEKNGAYRNEEPDLKQGLCCDCRSRHSCGLNATPEGGVWYCEEYR